MEAPFLSKETVREARTAYLHQLSEVPVAELRRLHRQFRLRRAPCASLLSLVLWHYRGRLMWLEAREAKRGS